jgi:hypothetical protein
VVILNIDENAFVIESDLAALDFAADRLSAHAILPFVVLPETRGQASSHVKPEGKLRTFKSLHAALKSAKTLFGIWKSIGSRESRQRR